MHIAQRITDKEHVVEITAQDIVDHACFGLPTITFVVWVMRAEPPHVNFSPSVAEFLFHARMEDSEFGIPEVTPANS